MSTIHLPGLRHLTSEQVHAERYTDDHDLLSDEAAVTIASWYQSPGSHGRAFAALASGVAVDSDDLLADIAYSLVHDAPHSKTGKGELLALERWVRAKVAPEMEERVRSYDVEGNPYDEVLRTKSGKVVTESDIQQWAEEAEAGYEIPDRPDGTH